MHDLKFKEVWALIAPYWRSNRKFYAWSLLIATLVLNLAKVGVMVALNSWYGRFYDAMQKLDKKIFFAECYFFVLLAAIFVAVVVANNLITSIFRFSWRRYLTEKYMQEWLSNNNYYKIALHRSVDNPDQRISEDLNTFTKKAVDLGTSFFKETINLVSFAGILWALSGALTIPLASGHNLVIPGYMMWAVLLYSVVGTWIAMKIGKPLINLGFQREKFEANFRYNLVRVREYNQEIAQYKGEKQEHNTLNLRFEDVYDNFKQLVIRNIYLNLGQNLYLNGNTIFPYLAASPMFFAKIITLGVLIQIVQAFNQVDSSLSVIVTNYNDIAEWFATAKRLVEFKKSMERPLLAADAASSISLIKNGNQEIKIANVSLFAPEGTKILPDIVMNTAKSSSTLIMGESGKGKSTLIKSIAGLWPFGEGDIYLPEGSNLMIVPQKPYMPIGTFRQISYYPSLAIDVSDDQLKTLLNQCNLSKFIDVLDERREWSKVLSPGEQQRVNFLRILLHKPEIIIMDEPTSSVDKDTEEKLFTILRQYLPKATVITVAHNINLTKFHDQVINIAANKPAHNADLAQTA